MAVISKSFDTLSAFGKLKSLAASPFDLTAPGAISSERLGKYVCKAAGYDLLYSAQRIDEVVLAELQNLADESEAVSNFLAMKKGDILNRIEGYESENRRVLHTACRDIFSQEPINIDATVQAKAQLNNLNAFVSDLDNGRIVNSNNESFTDMIHIGIGGSDLGPRALYLALEAYRHPGRKVHFISNVDPDDASAILKNVDLTRTLVNVVSKSGTTLETLTNERLVRAAFEKAGLAPEKHFIAVTGQGSPMDDPQKYLRSFHMYDYIGGRYSATSMVGAVMLSFGLGFNVFEELLKGANDMDIAAEEKDIRKNLPLLLALIGIWNHNFLGHETVAVLPYSQALLRFPAHLQQCDMESNGKSVTKQGQKPSYNTGPIVWGEPGTNGQHAFYQLIHQGTTVVPAEFIGFRQSQHEDDILINGTTSQEKLVANMLAQSLALAAGQKSDNPNKYFSGNRPSSILLTDRLTPYAMGALLTLYEAKIVFQGFIWNINSFDQEGVQLGKILANRILGHFGDVREKKPADETDDPAGWALLRTAGLLDL